MKIINVLCVFSAMMLNAQSVLEALEPVPYSYEEEVEMEIRADDVGYCRKPRGISQTNVLVKKNVVAYSWISQYRAKLQFSEAVGKMHGQIREQLQRTARNCKMNGLYDLFLLKADGDVGYSILSPKETWGNDYYFLEVDEKTFEILVAGGQVEIKKHRTNENELTCGGNTHVDIANIWERERTADSVPYYDYGLQSSPAAFVYVPSGEEKKKMVRVRGVMVYKCYEDGEEKY